jgi:hypothetical protein
MPVGAPVRCKTVTVGVNKEGNSIAIRKGMIGRVAASWRAATGVEICVLMSLVVGGPRMSQASCFEKDDVAALSPNMKVVVLHVVNDARNFIRYTQVRGDAEAVETPIETTEANASAAAVEPKKLEVSNICTPATNVNLV